MHELRTVTKDNFSWWGHPQQAHNFFSCKLKRTQEQADV